MTAISIQKTDETKISVDVVVDEDEGTLGVQHESILLSALLNTCGRGDFAKQAGFDIIFDFDKNGRLIGFETA